MPGWALLAIRLAPLILGAIEGAESKFPGSGLGDDKKRDVLETVEPVARDATGLDSEQLRTAVSWTVDAAVAWLKVFGRL